MGLANTGIPRRHQGICIPGKDVDSVKKFARIKKTHNLYEDVTEVIKTAILSGSYPSGSPLPGETELARQFAVSRPVIREALRALQSMGYLGIKRGTKGGTFVRDIIRFPLFDDFHHFILHRHFKVDHLAQARLFIEPEVCRLAAINASAEDIQGMKDLLAGYGGIKSADVKDYMYSRFHRLVGRACGNPIYAMLMEKIMDFTEGFIRTIKPVTTFIHHDHDHDAIIAAIEARNPEGAAKVAIRHATQISRAMLKLERVYLELLKRDTALPDASPAVEI
jgi:DNA-binding FadR family transcriptional regulator